MPDRILRCKPTGNPVKVMVILPIDSRVHFQTAPSKFRQRASQPRYEMAAKVEKLRDFATVFEVGRRYCFQNFHQFALRYFPQPG